MPARLSIISDMVKNDLDPSETSAMQKMLLLEGEKLNRLSRSPLPDLEKKDDQKRSKQFRMILRAVLPHVSLYVGSVVYLLAGAHVFILIERPFQNELRYKQTMQVQSLEEALTNQFLAKLDQYQLQQTSGKHSRLTELDNVNFTDGLSIGTAFTNYTTELYQIYRQMLLRPEHITDNMSGNYYVDRINNFGNVVFFVLSMTSTIGYGEMQPYTWGGKLFSIIYGAIGFPLILITVADLAKFVSHFLTHTYTVYLTWRARVVERIHTTYYQHDRRRISTIPRTPRPPSGSDEENMAEYVWENIDDIKYVQLPATFILAMITAYCALGALIFPYLEPWNGLESLYFSVVSVLKIGFGDYVPINARFQGIAIAYVLAGIILATSCVDTVGITYLLRLHYLGRKMGETDYLAMMKRQNYVLAGIILATSCVDTVGITYLLRLHYLGRKMGETDYLAMMKRRKYRKRRDETMHEMVGLLTFLRNMRVPTQDEMPWTPDPPRSLVCTSVTATSISLRWEPPENTHIDSVTYTLRCKAQRPWTKGPLRSKIYRRRWRSPSHYNMQPIEQKGLTQTTYTVRHLQSFTIYEITLYAVNKWGQSARTRLLQLTEPETAPQNIRTEDHRERGIRVMWDTPIKKKNDVKRYTIYYTDDLNAPYERWHKRYTDGRNRSVSFESLEENTTYVFSIAANYDSGHSPLSRSLFVAVSGTGTEYCREVTRSSGNTITENVGADSDDTTAEDSEMLIISTTSR